MTILHLQIMLHHYAIAAPYALNDHEHRCSPAVVDYHKNLCDWGLLEKATNWPSGYGVTERGACFVQAMKALPLPISETKWVMPALGSPT